MNHLINTLVGILFMLIIIPFAHSEQNTIHITSFCKPNDKACLQRELEFVEYNGRTPATDAEIEGTYGGMWYDEPPHPGWQRKITPHMQPNVTLTAE